MGLGVAAAGRRCAPGPPSRAQADAWLVPGAEVAWLPGQGTPPESEGVPAQLPSPQPACAVLCP